MINSKYQTQILSADTFSYALSTPPASTDWKSLEMTTEDSHKPVEAHKKYLDQIEKQHGFEVRLGAELEYRARPEDGIFKAVDRAFTYNETMKLGLLRHDRK